MPKWVAHLIIISGALSNAWGDSPRTIIVGGTLIDGNGGPPLRDTAIVVQGDRIVSIGSSHGATHLRGRRINAAGKFIIPGLMDANVHLVYGFSTEYLVKFESQFEDIIREGAQVALRNGVTTVFDTWGPLEPLKHVRNEIDQGLIEGARIFVGGNIVGLGGPFSPDFYASKEGISQETVHRIDHMYEQGVGHELVYMPGDQVRVAIDQYLNRGVDFFKYAVSGHADRELGFILFSPRVQKIMIREARQRGLTVETHTTSVESLRMAVESDVDLMQHCNVTVRELIPDELVEEIARKKIPCAMQFYPRRYLQHALGDNFDADPIAIADESQRSQSVDRKNQERLVNAGATILMMTDGGVAYAGDPLLNEVFFQHSYPEVREDIVGFFGNGHVAWLRGATEAGLPPMKVLQAATRNVAAAYNKLGDLGTLEAGKSADLIVLDADPLSDPANYAAVYLVMKSGKIVDRLALPRKRVLTDEKLYGHARL